MSVPSGGDKVHLTPRRLMRSCDSGWSGMDQRDRSGTVCSASNGTTVTLSVPGAPPMPLSGRSRDVREVIHHTAEVKGPQMATGDIEET